jgi:hypothetical protein
MEYRVNGEISLKDCWRVMCASHRLWMFFVVLQTTTLLILAGGFAVALMYGSGQWVMICSLIGLFLGFRLYRQVAPVRKYYRWYNEGPGTGTTVISDAGIEMKMDKVEVRYKWEGILKSRFADGIVLVYFERAAFIAYIRDMFASEVEWQGVCDLIREKTPSEEAPQL